MTYILVLDQGTTSSRALLLDQQAGITAVAQQEFKQHFPQSGWVEHDPEEIWTSQINCAREVLTKSGIPAHEISAIGITNQRETTVIWDRRSGEPLYNAIVRQDRRTAEFCDTLKDRGHTSLIQTKTGLLPDAYFSATKLRWLLQNVTSSSELAFGTVDSWLIWKLTGGKVHATDATNASRTMLFNIHDLEWDPELLELFQVPESVLPEVVDSAGNFGSADPEHLGASIPICGVAGDQQAALFGQLCHSPGMVKNTYGTGCFIMLNTGAKPVHSTNNLLTTLGWVIDSKPSYALEGSIFIGGAVVQWLRDGLKLIEHSSEVEALAASVENNGGVTFVPAFTGLGAPHWDPYARGSLFGLSRGSTDAHIARAALESIAFQTADVLAAMQDDAQLDLQEIRVDGGAAANDLLMQFQSDILNLRVMRPDNLESTAMGAGFLAGLGAGIWPDLEALQSLRGHDRDFEPSMTRENVEKHLAVWHQAVERAKGWKAVN